MASKAKAKTVKVAIIVDIMGGGGLTQEEEIEDHQTRYTKLLKPVKPLFYQALSAYPDGKHGIKSGTDLVVFDYGGMLPGNDLMESNSRELIKWVMDNPSSLAIVASDFTYRNAVEGEMRELGFDTLPNVVCDDGSLDDPIPQWFRDQISPPPAECLHCHKTLTGKATRCTECGKLVCADCLISADATTCVGCAPRFHIDLPPALASPFRSETQRRSFSAGMAARGCVLPSLKFFEPKKAFVTWFQKNVSEDMRIYDVGAGVGHVSAMLDKAGYKVTALDINTREEPEYPVTITDASEYPFQTGSLVLLARPCHGQFVENIISRALECCVDIIIYVGLPRNMEHDLGAYANEFNKMPNKAKIGKDGEVIYRWKL